MVDTWVYCIGYIFNVGMSGLRLAVLCSMSNAFGRCANIGSVYVGVVYR